MENGPTPKGWTPDWITADGFYAARVWFGHNDYAIICACSLEPVQKGMDIVMDLYAAAMTAGPKADEMAVFETVRQKLSKEKVAELVACVDELIEECLVTWKMSGLAELPAFAGEAPAPPNMKMEEGERTEILRFLPIPVKLRLVAGIFWQLKNSLGGFRKPAPA